MNLKIKIEKKEKNNFIKFIKKINQYASKKIFKNN